MRTIRAIAASVWMGWQRDLEWTNPLLSLGVKAIAPAAAVLSASIVYWYGSSFVGRFSPERLAYIVVGASLYAQIATYAYVPTAAISEGKWTNVYPQVCITPTSSIPYLAGRCLASFTASVPIVIVSLVVSYYVSGMLFGLSPVLIVSSSSVSMFAVALLASIPAVLGLGYLLGSYSIFVSRFEWALPSYISGVLMIFSEALFPATVLPWPLSLFSEALPFTYFMRASRAALIYGSISAYAVSMSYALLGGLLFLAVGLVAFRWAEKRGREKGLIDRKVG